MKKPTKQLSDSDNLVMIQLGYYCRFVLPVEAATEVMRLMVQAGAEKVESDQGVYYPVDSDLRLEMLDKPFMADCPKNSAKRQEYFAWLKTKAELVGKCYEPESYSEYLVAKGEWNDYENFEE